MASGGFPPNKQGKPEPKRRSNWQRSVSSDRDDAQSLNSLPSDIRINNWDLSDLRPTNLGGDSKRRKKSKGNPEREREQSLSVDSPPHDQKHHTPSSYSRTKISPGTPTSQRVALENLKQQMTFSDIDDQVSTDGERNNERQASHGQRRRLHNTSFNHTESESDRRINRNNNMDYTNRDQEPDSNQVIARLMQIRDFMKQARSMLDSMERLGDRKKAEDIEKVRRLIRNLQEQEQGYRGLLQNTLQAQRDDDDDERDGARAHVRPEVKVEVKEDSDDDTSVDLEVKTENSETSDNSQESRPRIESKLGIESEDDGDHRQESTRFADSLRGATASGSSASAVANANTSENATMRRSPELDNTLVPGVPIQESDEGARAAATVENDSPTLQHQELLRILKEKQQQLQALMGRQEELNFKRRQTEKKLLQAQARDNKARAALSAITAGKQYVEQRLASHQTQSLLEAVTATSAAQAAATATAAAAATMDTTWDKKDHQQRQQRLRRDNDELNRDNDDEDDDEENDDDDKGAVGESRVLKSNIVGYPESDDEDNSNVRELGAATSLPNDLQELRRQLNFLRNEFNEVSETPKNMSSNPLPSLDEGRQQLQNKLQELQNKRSGMDKLLQELQMIHSQPLEPLRNNGSALPQASSNSQSWHLGSSNIPNSRQQQPLLPPPPPPPQASQHHHHHQRHPAPVPALPSHPPPSNVPMTNPSGIESSLPANLQARMNDMAAPTSSAVDNALSTFAQLAAQGSDQEQASASMDPLMVAEVQEKLRRLKEVRGQLDQLRGLVQYYQNQRDELEPSLGDTPEENATMTPAGDESSDRRALTKQSKPNVRSARQPVQEQQGQVTEGQEFLRPQQDKVQPQQRRQAEESGAVGGSSSLQNMVQLLNLAGTDQGDEHSDEDNASVSQSESQWSHLGPWDDDPEIQEKVKKLKAAKEKLRQLQDLVAFVQQSPEAARTLPENLGELANSTEEGEGEAVSQATQTDEPNASISEGEILSDSNQLIQQRVDGADNVDGTRAELERLRKERAMLLEIQNQLKQIQDQTEGVSSATEDRRQERREAREESNGDLSKPEQTSNAPVVTFASNDELYSKMRRQRILREELRSKKKELEAIMKKDRNKRQYSRNQDNQSDTVSLNTDTFGIPASVDATMATWGGSTVDNLENITEDEDGQERNDREERDEDEEDDGYPSDGIVQVEEEEEENDSDNGTYTIEADARQRQTMRKGQIGVNGGIGIGARPKTSRGRQTYPQPTYNDKSTKKPSKRQNAGRSKRNPREYKPRQENYRSAEDLIEEDESTKVESSEWFQQIQERLSTLTSSVEVLLRKSDNESRQLSVSLSQENAPQTNSMISPMQEQMLQLQNQSMMLSFGQVVQSLARQQGDMHQLQQQLQNLQLQVQEVQEVSFHGGVGGAGSHLLRPSLTQTPLNNSSYNLQASMSLNPQQMPSPFTQSALNNSAPPGFLGGFSPGLRTIQQQAAGLGLSTGNLSTAGVDNSTTNVMGRTGGSGAAGAGLSVNTVSSSLNPTAHHLPSVSGFVFNPLSQSTLSSQYNHHQSSTSGGHLNLNYNPHRASSSTSLHNSVQGAVGDPTVLGAGGSSASTMTRDFSQFVNTLHPVSSPTPEGLSPGQFTTGLFGGSSSQAQHLSGGGVGTGLPSLFPTSSFLSSHLGTDERDGDLDDENPMPRTSTGRNKKRKYGTRVKKSESDPTSGPRMSTARSENTDDGESSTAAAPLWSLSRGSAYRTGANLNGGFDANSSYSSIQSIRDQHSKIRSEQTKAKSTDTGEDSNTLFETLRDTIYTEVASLISQNESRPHFLLELFRDIRQVDSDFMRQRTLYAMEELLRSRIKEDADFRSSNPSWMKINAAETANSEQTPSESITSEDDEDLKVTRLQEEITVAERSRLNRLTRGEGSLRSYPFDYVEVAENPSSLSTPTNGADDAPFFQDALGETVIGFESLRVGEPGKSISSKAKSKKRGASNGEEGGRQRAKLGEGGFLASEQLLKELHHQKNAGTKDRNVGEDDLSRPRRYRPAHSLLQGAIGGVMASQESHSSEVASSSAMDQASESSLSDMPYPRIDMKQLDRQIKAIMLETIPVVKEHIEDICSSQLLAYIKRLVLSLTGQIGSQEFARFFHRQLATILEDTLQKYHGRKMRECGEDLLVEISDVLFNELAFFRLMQDLDDPNVSGRYRANQQTAGNKDENSSDFSEESSYSADEDEDNGNSKKATGKKGEHHPKQQKRTKESQGEVENTTQRGFRISEADQEELGRERDDEMARQVRVNDADEKDDDEAEHSYKIELAPSETKPFTRIGSDEDDDEGDEEQSMEDPSETAVSRDSMLEITKVSSSATPDRQQQLQVSFSAQATLPRSSPTSPRAVIAAQSGNDNSSSSINTSTTCVSTRPETEGSQGDGTEKQDEEKPITAGTPSPSKIRGGARPNNGEVEVCDAGVTATENGVSSASNNNSSANNVNGGDNDDELTVDDLPERLNVGPALSDAVNNNNSN